MIICEDFLTFLKNPYPNFFGFVIIHCGKPLILYGRSRTGMEFEIAAGEENRMKKKLLAAVLFGVLVMSAGCTKSNILKPEPSSMNAPDFTPVEHVELDWDQVSEDVMSYYEDIEYPGLLTFNFAHKDEEKQIIAQLFVDESVSLRHAADYASDLIKYINDSVASQDGSVSLSGNDSYGSFFDEYSFTVQVIPELSQDDESNWLVNMTVAAGEHTPITWQERNEE